MRKLFREPLLHFLLIGSALFLLFNVVSGGRGGADRQIVINDATVARIAQVYQRVWKRPVSSTELRGLIDSYVREEILFREGVAMGLDRDDAVIRRRVQQKMVVVAEESTARPAPTDAELDAYLKQHAERYFRPTGIGFDQVIFKPTLHGPNLDADVGAALVQLRAGAAPDTIGDGSLLPTTTADTQVDLLARDYGADFAASAVGLRVGTWSGPIASGYGVHLVRITSKTPGRPLTLAEARTTVERDWESDRRLLSSEDYYKKARQKYDVVIEASLAGAKSGVSD